MNVQVDKEEESLLRLLKQWKKKYTSEELKSIINYVQNPINKLIAEKLLLDK